MVVQIAQPSFFGRKERLISVNAHKPQLKSLKAFYRKDCMNRQSICQRLQVMKFFSVHLCMQLHAIMKER
jgi:hypothetical protein